MRRLLARVALAWDVAAIAAPSVVGVLTGHRVGAREAVAVELAGSGARILVLARGDRGRLETYRRVLGRGDDAYVAFYSLGLMAGVLLLGGRARGAGVAVVCGAAMADLVENGALEQALCHLLEVAHRGEGVDLLRPCRRCGRFPGRRDRLRATSPQMWSSEGTPRGAWTTTSRARLPSAGAQGLGFDHIDGKVAEIAHRLRVGAPARACRRRRSERCCRAAADPTAADPTAADPAVADPDLVRARQAAQIKFGLLIPAVALSLAGVIRELGIRG